MMGMLWFVVLLIFGGVLLVVVLRQQDKQWKELPTLSEYLDAHLDWKTEKGIECSNCNSASIRSWGATSRKDSFRSHICNHCETKLYRTGD